MTKEFISPEGVFKARGYVHAVKAGNTIYVAGQGGYGPDGNIIRGISAPKPTRPSRT